jgi:hypothetical protein
MQQDNPLSQSLRTVSLADEEGVKQILVSTVFGLWDIVNNLTRLRPSKRERYRVTMFGSARAQPGTYVYDEVKRVATVLAEMGCDIITGGGPGLMQAANEGAAAAKAPERNRSVGIRVDLPFEQEVNPFVEQAFEHKTFFTRLHHFVLTSDAFVVAPGGIGTVLELMMIWQLTPGPARTQRSPDPRRQDVDRVGELGEDAPVDFSAAASQSGRYDNPALREHRRRGHCVVARTSRPVVAGAERRCIALRRREKGKESNNHSTRRLFHGQDINSGAETYRARRSRFDGTVESRRLQPPSGV